MTTTDDPTVKVIKKCFCQWLWPPPGWSHYDNCDVLREEKELEEWIEGVND